MIFFSPVKAFDQGSLHEIDPPNLSETTDPVFQLQSYLEFVNSVDLGELHVVVEQSLGNDVQDAQPLYRHQLILMLGIFWVNVSLLWTAVTLP